MVDEIRQWPTKIACFKPGSCHLTADGERALEELHAFAKRLGMKREWFQDHAIAPHYDLTIGKRGRALELGAVFVSAREQALARRKARGLPLSSVDDEGGSGKMSHMACLKCHVEKMSFCPTCDAGPNGSAYERAAFSNDPEAPIAALKDSAIEALREKAQSWEPDDRMAVMTLSTEVRYLRRKVVDLDSAAVRRPLHPDSLRAGRIIRAQGMCGYVTAAEGGDSSCILPIGHDEAIHEPAPGWVGGIPTFHPADRETAGGGRSSSALGRQQEEPERTERSVERRTHACACTWIETPTSGIRVAHTLEACGLHAEWSRDYSETADLLKEKSRFIDGLTEQ